MKRNIKITSLYSTEQKPRWFWNNVPQNPATAWIHFWWRISLRSSA